MKNIQISDDTHKLVKQFLLDEGLKTLDAAIGLAVARAQGKGVPAGMNPAPSTSIFPQVRTTPLFAGMRPAGTPPNTRNE